MIPNVVTYLPVWSLFCLLDVTPVIFYCNWEFCVSCWKWILNFMVPYFFQPVHKWMVRHVYFPCLRNGLPKVNILGSLTGHYRKRVVGRIIFLKHWDCFSLFLVLYWYHACRIAALLLLKGECCFCLSEPFSSYISLSWVVNIAFRMSS